MNPEDELFHKYMYLGKATIYKMFPQPMGICRKHRIEMDDLLQYSYTGLFKACKNFNPDKKVKFTTYAISSIRFHILERLNRETSIIKYSTNRTYDESELYRLISMDVELDADTSDHNTYHDVICSDINVELDVIDNIDEEYIFSKLGDKQKEIIKLKEKGLSSGDIGKLWNMTPANVRWHANKARKQLEDYHLEVI